MFVNAAAVCVNAAVFVNAVVFADAACDMLLNTIYTRGLRSNRLG